MLIIGRIYRSVEFIGFKYLVLLVYVLHRHERWKNRSNQKEELYYSEENENSDNESLHDSVRSCNTLTGGFIVGRGRQTNNSLSSAAGEIIIHSTEKNHSPEW